ncbi:MAG: hypothetical protein U9N07_00940 [Euryarchaeota archaeon]|nr:hypothetical protein [Euryarchaeota archaeon]
MTNKSCDALLIVVMLAAIAIPIACGAEVETQFASLTLTAENVNCADCHPENPHIIHKEKLDTGKVTCEACHGEAFEIGIPKCTKCHSGPIHQVHIGKVNTEDCTYCHKDLEKVHYDVFGGKELVCAHCHGDIVAEHGVGMDSCTKCHKTAPDIVKPVKSAGMTILCQACHKYDDAASIHGDLSDPTGCYKCHRTTPNATVTEIPHNLHIPIGVGCEMCHLSSGTKIIIPQCGKCHDAVGIHELSKIGLRAATPDCAVCHGKPPEKAVKETPPPAKPTPTEEGPAEVEATPAGRKLPGFAGLFAVAALLSAIYWRRR